MRKKILAAIVAAAMTDRKLAGGKKLSNKGKTDSLKKTEEVAEEIVAEKVVTEEDVQEDTIEKTIIEENINEEDINEEKIYEQVVTTDQPIIDEIITEEKTVEIHNEFAYEFEGKYWLRYSDYGHKGLYFDGSKAISKTENQGTFEKDYFVEDNLINIGGESYFYEIVNGKLGLAMTRDMMGGFSYYDEVEKAEYDSIFSYYFKM